MTEREFIVWLKGYFEIENPKEISETQTQIIRDHLESFFNKVTPDRTTITIKEDTAVSPDTIIIKHGELCTCPSCNAIKMLPKNKSLIKCSFCGQFHELGKSCPGLTITC